MSFTIFWGEQKYSPGHMFNNQVTENESSSLHIISHSMYSFQDYASNFVNSLFVMTMLLTAIAMSLVATAIYGLYVFQTGKYPSLHY